MLQGQTRYWVPSGAPFHASMTYAGLKLAFVEHPRPRSRLVASIGQYLSTRLTLPKPCASCTAEAVHHRHLSRRVSRSTRRSGSKQSGSPMNSERREATRREAERKQR